MKRLSFIICHLSFSVALVAFTACSSSEDSIIDEQPVNPAQKTYTLTVNATKGSDAQTRALSLDNNTLNVKWAATDEVSVFPAAWSRTALGTLTAAASDNGSTSLTGDLTTLPAVTDNLNLLFPRATWDYTGQTGVLLTDANSIEKKYDYALADVEVATVDGNKITTTGDANFQSQQAIVKFTLLDQSRNPLDATSLTISAASGKLVTGIGYNTISRHSGYTYDNGSAYADATSQLVDGNPSSKWCSNTSHKTDGIYFCEFHTASAVRVDGYTLTTGDDNDTWNGRNPKDWVLKAKVNASDATWTTIATVTNDATLEDKDTTPYDFYVDTPGEYQYFRIEISSTRGGNGTMQLGEMQLFEKTHGTAYGDLTVTPGGSGASELTVALRNENDSDDTYTLSADVGGTGYGYSKSGVTFANGSYYDITVKMAETVTWNSSNCSSMYIFGGDSSYDNTTIAGIKLKCNAETGDASWNSMEEGISFAAQVTGGFTFTAPTGKKFSKIEMTANETGDWRDAIYNGILGTGWPSGYDAMSYFDSSKKIFWTGDASTVGLLTDADSFFGPAITSIVFYLK